MGSILPFCNINGFGKNLEIPFDVIPVKIRKMYFQIDIDDCRRRCAKISEI